MTITTYQPDTAALAVAPRSALIESAQKLGVAKQFADALCRTSFVPKHFSDKPEEAAAALIFGDELGFEPTQSLRSIYVIGGTPALYARAMVALVMSRGHEVWTEKDTPAEVVVCGRRRGSDKVERVAWTTDRARRAGYTSNKKYDTDPQAMLYARASSDVCRRIAPDVLAGISYTVEEMELEETEAPKKVSRRKPAELPPPMPEPDLEAASEQPAETPESPYLNPQSSLAKRMFATMNEAGISEKEERLRYVSDVIGREVTSSKEMTDADALLVIDVLTAQLAQSKTDEPQGDEPPVDTPATEELPIEEPPGWEK